MKNEGDKPRQGKRTEEPSYWRWVLRIFLIALVLSGVLSFASALVLEDAGYVLAVLVLALFVALGIAFDIAGVAVTAASPKPFHSMAAHREKGAKEALYLLKNAEKVSSFCNDVVGDICGIVSGATAAVIVLRLQRSFNTESILISIGVTALISGLTIGGKALGKKLALDKSTEVVFFFAKLLRPFRIANKR